MEKELNLVELLKDAPMGTKLFSPICGECELMGVVQNDDSKFSIKVHGKDDFDVWTFTKNGHYFSEKGECLLFPSRENRDWSTFKKEKEVILVGDYIKSKKSEEFFRLTSHVEAGFWAKRCKAGSYSEVYINDDKLGEYEKVEKFNPEWLKPFDRVLVYDSIWVATLFSHLTKIKDYTCIMCNGEAYKYCIPFNEETKHLIGTIEDEPEFYKI